MKSIRSLFVAALLASSPALADWAKPTNTTVVGEVVDTTCFILHEGKGPEHKACAATCTRAGSPAAILDEKTHMLVYALNPISPENHHTKRPDERLLPFVGERVKVTGALYERAGVRAIVVENVARADEAKK